jgi:hypothetical protein
MRRALFLVAAVMMPLAGLAWTWRPAIASHPKEVATAITTAAIKLLSAGLIATAMLATSAMARENYIAKRHVVGEADTRTSPTVPRCTDGRVGIPAPRVGALPAPPDGENCDVGDNPFICLQRSANGSPWRRPIETGILADPVAIPPEQPIGQIRIFPNVVVHER